MAEVSPRVLRFAARVSGGPCRFILHTDEKPFRGGQCVVFALEATHGWRFAVRVEHNISEAILAKQEWQVWMLKTIKDFNIPHLPFLVGHELSPSPPLIATSWADGCELQWSDTVPPPHVRKHVIRRIAGVTLDMLKIQNPGLSALDWITSKIIRTRVNRVQQGNLEGISLSDAENLKAQISLFHLPHLDNAPYVLVHGDLQPSNIIMNDETLSSVIDLGCASMIPLQFSTLYPKFLTNEPRQTGDTFDWSPCCYSEKQVQDRDFYLQCIKEIAPTKGLDAQIYAEILGREDQEARHWWLSAVFRLDMMRALKTKP
ncbi:kinase-like domain [Cordyceps militaris]|uniref:Kinase-like domain n=1 Tax=Cordyceps militaris TaxID=73501 RepID=A0A2H4SLY0_CORMI|nr:kinase-like domain [Cordyceps militaris]